MNKVTKNFKGLEKLRNRLHDLTTYRADVGLFESAAYRAKKPYPGGNASLGFEHEFGNPGTNLPERSFLRMPLEQHLPNLLNLDWFINLTKNGPKKVVALLGVIGEEIVQEAFATGGFGQWPALAERTIKKKGSSAILIDTAQMRKAIASRVV